MLLMSLLLGLAACYTLARGLSFLPGLLALFSLILLSSIAVLVTRNILRRQGHSVLYRLKIKP